MEIVETVSNIVTSDSDLSDIATASPSSTIVFILKILYLLTLSLKLIFEVRETSK